MNTRYAGTLAGLLAASTLVTGVAGAHAAGFDDTFGINGTVFTPLTALGDRYLSTTRAPGGGTFNVGYTTVAGTDRAIVLSRVDAGGELVGSFGTGGVVVLNAVTGPFAAPPAGTAPTGAGETARDVAVQSDGKIVVVGQGETPPAAGKPDSRDTDIYVARFNANGTPDATFGTAGVKRVDLSNGVGAANAINGDQVYGLALRPDDKIVLFGSKGLDSTEPARTDRDIVAVQLLANGDLDPAFGTGGVATTRNAGVSENPRFGLIQPDGKVIATGYGTGIGGQTRPFVYRFNANGSTDLTFGTAGVATDAVGGPAPGLAEVYDVVQQGDKYVFTGYGSRSTTPANGIDVLLYRFNADGTWDRTFGQDGLFTYNRVNGADRGRALTALADGRLVVAGSTATADATPLLDALILVVKPDGSGTDASVGLNGALIRDLGGSNDAYFGVTTVANGTKVVAAGYRAGTDSTLDDAVLTRAELAPAVAGPVGPTGPAGADGADGTTVNAAPGAPGAAGPAGPAGPRGADGASIRRVSVTCKLTGKRKNKVSCTTKLTRTASATVKLRLTRAGKVVARGSAKARGGKAAVALQGSARKGRYTLRGTAGDESIEIAITLR